MALQTKIKWHQLPISIQIKNVTSVGSNDSNASVGPFFLENHAEQSRTSFAKASLSCRFWITLSADANLKSCNRWSVAGWKRLLRQKHRQRDKLTCWNRGYLEENISIGLRAPRVISPVYICILYNLYTVASCSIIFYLYLLRTLPQTACQSKNNHGT